MEFLYLIFLKLKDISMTLPDGQNILFFFMSSIVLIITPGPAMIYIITRSVEQGMKTGLLSVLGIESGTLIHVIAAAFGVAIVIASSPIAMGLIKYAGGSYLAFLGIQQFGIKKTDSQTDILQNGKSCRGVFLQGVLVNVLNVKAVLFFTAFLPQFINPAKGGINVQILFLGMLFILTAIGIGSLLVLASGQIKSSLTNKKDYLKMHYISGSIYLILELMILTMF